MGKLLDKFKLNLRVKAMTQGKVGVETLYSMWLFGIDGYISGEPSRIQKQVMKRMIPTAIGNKTPFQREAQAFVKELVKKKEIESVDIVYLETQLKPWFVDNMKEDTNKVLSDIEKIDVLKVEKNFDLLQKASKGQIR